jgi:hypothetical protein
MTWSMSRFYPVIRLERLTFGHEEVSHFYLDSKESDNF